MVDESRKQKKGTITEEDASNLIERYSVETVLALLQEVAQVTGDKIDWNAMVKNTATRIYSAKEYQALWRHLAYGQNLIDQSDDDENPMDDDSDLEYEREASPAVSREASAEAAACVKVLIASGQNDLHLPNSSTIDAPLTINIPNSKAHTATSDSSSITCAIQGMNVSIPVTVQKQPLSSGTCSEKRPNGSTEINFPPRKRRRGWSTEDDAKLTSAVQKFGERNWASIARGDFKNDRKASELSQEMDVMDMENVSELITRSDKRTGKFHPKPKMKMQEICERRIESVSIPFCPRQVSPKINFANKEPLPAFEHEDVLDLSSIGFTPTIPVDSISELPVNDGSTNLMEMNQLVSGIHVDSVSEIPAKFASRRAKARKNDAPAASESSQPEENVFTCTRENEPGRSLRPRKPKTNICEIVDESEDETLTGKVSADECRGSSALEDNINNEEYQVGSEFVTKKVKRNCKKQDSEKEKTARKRKTSKGASEQDVDAKPKKFSHSTRRRKMDRVLLETPEDEIDYQKVPLRDLIMLAEHKERQMKKEESVAGAPSTKPSQDNSSEFFNKDNDGHLSPTVEESGTYFNYLTYMDRTPITRWSKKETELFYEGVRQFGTDLSLIQQLFPGRTRRQVKLKYKKEERQQPLRLRDSLTNRSKDHSHFEAVIVRLQQIAAEENENAGSTELGDNDVADEGILDASDVNHEETKNEQQIEGQEKEEDIGQDLAEDGSPLKLYDSEDDLFRWSQYKSDT